MKNLVFLIKLANEISVKEAATIEIKIDKLKYEFIKSIK